MKLKNLNLKARILFFTGLTLFLSLLSSIFKIYSLYINFKDLESLYNNSLIPIVQLNNIMKTILQLRTNELAAMDALIEKNTKK